MLNFKFKKLIRIMFFPVPEFFRQVFLFLTLGLKIFLKKRIENIGLGKRGGKKQKEMRFLQTGVLEILKVGRTKNYELKELQKNLCPFQSRS